MQRKQKLSDIKNIIYSSFPKKLELDVNEVINILPINEKVVNIHGQEIDLIRAGDCRHILIERELLTIEYRIYFNEPNFDEEEALSDIQKVILNCLYSCHSDGYIREKRVKKLLTSNNYFVIPFVMSLAGQYLIEILTLININVNNVNIKLFIKFMQENPKYWLLTKNRIVSNWNWFYRNKYIYFKDYVGSDFIEKLEYYQTHNKYEETNNLP